MIDKEYEIQRGEKLGLIIQEFFEFAKEYDENTFEAFASLNTLYECIFNILTIKGSKEERLELINNFFEIHKERQGARE